MILMNIYQHKLLVARQRLSRKQNLQVYFRHSNDPFSQSESLSEGKDHEFKRFESHNDFISGECSLSSDLDIYTTSTTSTTSTTFTNF